MSATELSTFIEKFKELWKNGHGAHLDIDCYAGQAWVGLRVRLGHVPGPHHHQDNTYPSKRTKDSPSRQRRRARRAAARQQKEARVATEDRQNVEETLVVDETTEAFNEAAVAVEETASATEEILTENQEPVTEKVVGATSDKEGIYEEVDVTEDVIDVAVVVEENDTEKVAKENEMNSNELQETDENCDENNVEVTEIVGENYEEDNSCDHCDFIGKTPAGLKTHRTTKHRYLFRRFSR